MLLREMTSKEQELFLELCSFLANVDGEHSPKEKAYINEYRHEMNLNDYKIVGLPFGDIVSRLKAGSPENKRRVMIEAVALLKADGNMDNQERGILAQLQAQLGISDDVVQEICLVLDDLDKVYTRIYQIVKA